jgi:branched-chain amino acid transport system ATP-binding protein
MLLEAADLHVRYGRTHAVNGVSVSVGVNQIVAVLGANGAGKSSLLKALQGVVPRAAGSIRLDGQEIGAWPAPQRVRAGLVLVPEGRQIFITLSVHENLLMGAYTRHDDMRRELDAIYDRFPNLAQRRDMPASVLSGGEQQMLAIARGLLARPRVMMLDEPSLGLSPILVQRLFQLIGELRGQGIAILLVEQNTNKALQIADRGSVLELGRLAAQGSPAELLADDRLRAAYLGG